MLKMLLDASGGTPSSRRRRRSHVLLRPSCSPLLLNLCAPATGIVLTNDGNAILREIDVSHPAAKARAVRRVRSNALLTPPPPAAQSMIELARTQDEEVGDGTTSVIILGARSRLGTRVDQP
jgi:T-complex protein 1 subunit gamma